MPAKTKAILEKENRALRRRAAKLEKQLAQSAQVKPALKRIEARLRESERSLNTIFEQTSVGAAIVNSHSHRFLRVNRKYCEIIGYSEKETLALKFSEITHPQDLSADLANMQRLIAGEIGDFTMEKRYVRKDGTLIWVSLTVLPLWIGRMPDEELTHIAIAVDITERKQAEDQRAAALEALRRSEAKFRAIAETGYDGLTLLDAQGMITYTSSATQRLSGYSAEERLGHSALELAHPEDRETIQQLSQALRVPGSVVTKEYRAKHKDGSWHWLEFTAQNLLKDPDIHAIVVTSHDITERKQAEDQRAAALEALRRSEAKFHALAENSNDGLILLDANGSITYRSPVYCQMSGYSAEERLGRDGFELTHPEDWEDMHRAFSQLLQNPEEIIYGEYRAKHKDGTWRWIEAKARNLLNDPVIQSIVVSSHDITKRKQAEESLRESEDKFKYIFEHSNVGNSITRISGEIRVNKAFSEMTGFSMAELEGKRWQDITHPDDIELTQREVDALVSGEKESTRFFKRFIKKDGSIIWVDLNSILRRDEKGHPIYLVTSLVDITDRKLAEQELIRAHEQLQELSRQLFNAQETERRAVARELHDEIGQSLTGLKILLEMAQRPLVEEDRTKIKQAQLEVSRLIERVSRLSLNLRPPMLDDFGLLPALLWLTDKFAARAEIQIDFTHAGIRDRRFIPAIEIAAYRLVQSSLTNVVRHACAKQAKVHVSADETHLRLLIEDEGGGFDLDATLAQGQAGGLSGMDERIRLLGGDFAIQTAPGKGTRITISLPLHDAQKKVKDES